MLWRNGLGSTLEIARAPLATEPFHWRLSLATIAHSGPFSTYPEYLRSVSLIDGAGFRLDVEGQEPAQLDTKGHTVQFPGNAPTTCTLIDGPCTDLSLMVRAPGSILSVTTQLCDVERIYQPPPGAMQAFFCLADAAVVTAQDKVVRLAQHDTCLTDCDSSTASSVTASSKAGALLRLVWSA